MNKNTLLAILLVMTSIFSLVPSFAYVANSQVVDTCTDGIDNDGDLLTDEADECSEEEEVVVEVEEEVTIEFVADDTTCTDGIDNDGDLLEDEADECPEVEEVEEPVVAALSVDTCTDGIDNDGDLLIDEADECTTASVVVAVDECTDGIDNDGDLLIDEADECGVAPALTDTCTDGIDNDGDLLIDEADECPPVTVVDTCTDGIDNDGDLLIDEADECPPVTIGGGGGGSTPEAFITIEKTVINDDGRTKTVSDFVFRIDGVEVSEGTALSYAPGTYTLSEDDDDDYEASDWGGDCAIDGTITVADGDDAVCTITNDDDPVTTSSSGGGGGSSSNDDDDEGEIAGDSIDLTESEGEVLGDAIVVPTVPHTGTGTDMALYLSLVTILMFSIRFVYKRV